METKLIEILIRIEKKLGRILKFQCENLAENLGTKRPRSPYSRDKTSPPVLAWSEPWHVGVGLNVFPVETMQGFDGRYVLKPRGPTKFLERFIDHLMSFPQNRNFRIKSKRCYVHYGNDLWQPIKAKRFYQEIREKILTNYRPTVLSSQHEHLRMLCQNHFKNMKIPWTNQYLEWVLAPFGSSWTKRKKGEKI